MSTLVRWLVTLALLAAAAAGVFLGLPSLDIGTRQTNRATAPSLFTAAAGDRPAIDAFLRDQWGRAHGSHTAFGEGRAADRFVAVLRDPAFWARGLQKRFSDLG